MIEDLYNRTRVSMSLGCRESYVICNTNTPDSTRSSLDPVDNGRQKIFSEVCGTAAKKPVNIIICNNFPVPLYWRDKRGTRAGHSTSPHAKVDWYTGTLVQTNSRRNGEV